MIVYLPRTSIRVQLVVADGDDVVCDLREDIVGACGAVRRGGDETRAIVMVACVAVRELGRAPSAEERTLQADRRPSGLLGFSCG